MTKKEEKWIKGQKIRKVAERRQSSLKTILFPSSLVNFRT